MQKLNTTLVYILSIAGFICCCWFLGIAIIPTGIAFYIATKELKKYEANPSEYMNGPAMKTAKTVAMVIFILSALYFVYSMISLATTPWDVVMEQWREGWEASGQDPEAFPF
jgi:energy-converting hydrogenase Eha subunit G